MNKLLYSTLIILIGTLNVWSQQPKDTLNTEVVNVVKPYTPTISDAFKVKAVPYTPETSEEKEYIDYKINSVPVASTFAPSKGKAKTEKRQKKERLFANYISIGAGNYTTPIFEAYVRTFPNKHSEFGALVKHHSSQGGIKDLQFNDAFYDSNLNVYYKQATRDMDWKLNFGAGHHLYNWYGLPQEITDNGLVLLDEYDPVQSYFNLEAGGDLTYYDSFFKGGKARVSSLFDRYKSNEIRVRLEPVLEFPISSEIIQFAFDIDYLKGHFERDYSSYSEISYAHFNFGVLPSFEVLRDNLHINLGAKLYASTGDGESMVLSAYPNVSASYQLIDGLLTIFGGVTGGLHQNSYLGILQENPYLSPNFNSVQTDEKYRAYGGVKGKLKSNINYLFKGSYADERDKPLQVLNRIRLDESLFISESYELGNSFGVVYDDVKTLAFHGELAIDLSKELTLGGKVDYATYTLKNELEAWNLPNLKATLFAAYHKEKWMGTAKLFMMGTRNDLQIPQFYSRIDSLNDFIVTNDSYLDFNLGFSYAFTERLSAFAKGHNLFGTSYNRFYNYPVQSMQVLGGITYKFDL